MQSARPPFLGVFQLRNLIRAGKTQAELVAMGHSPFRVQAAFALETTGRLPDSLCRFAAGSVQPQRRTLRDFARVDSGIRTTQPTRTTRDLIRISNHGRRIAGR